MSIILILLAMIGIAIVLATFLLLIIFLACLVYAVAMGSYKTVKYKTWTEEGRERLRRDSAL
jgi:amino acid transporter